MLWSLVPFLQSLFPSYVCTHSVLLLCTCHSFPSRLQLSQDSNTVFSFLIDQDWWHIVSTQSFSILNFWIEYLRFRAELICTVMTDWVNQVLDALQNVIRKWKEVWNWGNELQIIGNEGRINHFLIWNISSLGFCFLSL